MLSGMVRGVGRLIAAVASVLRASLVVAMGVMLACIVFQVVMRYVFANAPSWSEELALLMFAWATMGGLALGVREGFHVRLDIVIDHLPPPLRRWAESGYRHGDSCVRRVSRVVRCCGFWTSREGRSLPQSAIRSKFCTLLRPSRVD